MKAVGNLPTQKQSQCTAKQAIRIQARYKYEGSKHHSKIPVIDAAGGAAPILHKPRLEGTEEQDANDIADRIRDCDQDHDAAINPSGKVQKSENRIEDKPYDCHESRRLPGLIGGRFLSRRLIISRKLLLTSHTLQSRREETEKHFYEKEYPSDSGQDRMLLQYVGSIQYVEDKNRKEQGRSQNQLDDM